MLKSLWKHSHQCLFSYFIRERNGYDVEMFPEMEHDVVKRIKILKILARICAGTDSMSHTQAGRSAAGRHGITAVMRTLFTQILPDTLLG